MRDRTDWPLLDNFNYRQLAVTIDQHPKSISIRSRNDFYASHIRDGKALPCAYAFRDGLAEIKFVCAGLRRDGQLYYGTIARNKEPNPAYPDFVYWRWGEKFNRNFQGNTLLTSTEWAYWADDDEWTEGTIGVERIGGLPTFDQFLFSSSSFSSPIFPRVGPLIQCYLWTEYFEPVPVPERGPSDLPWPPLQDEWWANAFTDASSASN